MDIDKIIREWFFKLPKGYAEQPYSQDELQSLAEVFVEQGIDSANINSTKSPSVKGHILESKRDATLNTAMMESAACIGIGGISTSAIDPLLNLPSVFKKIKVKKQKDVEDYIAQCKHVIKITTTAQKQLKFGTGDFRGDGISIIDGFKPPIFDPVSLEFHENSMQDIALCCALAKGMSIYCSNIIGGDAKHFIHAGIGELYAAEKARGLTRQGSKANTADCVISNVSKSTLLAAIGDVSNIIEGTKDGYVKVGDNIKYWQVSLKKSATGAQMGKVTKSLRGVYDLGISTGEATDLLKGIKPSTNEGLVYEVLAEGFIDNIKTFATKSFNAIKGKLNSAISSFRNKFIGGLQNGQSIPPSAVSALLSGYTLKEGKMSPKLKTEIDTIAQNPTQAIKNVNAYIDTLSKKVKSNKFAVGTFKKVKPTKNIRLSGDKHPGSTTVMSLIANIATAELITDLVSDASKMKGIIGDLTAEMLFGGTKLPVWKVYGAFGSTPYSYLGTADIIEKRLSESDIDFKMLAVKAIPSPNKTYYTITCLILSELTKDNQKYYTLLRTGTNSSSRLTFTMEGTKLLGPYPINHKLQSLID
tara:strand:+ start:93 stop:1853 length:1761 start_codon:yes stop_codon:yes gene_type:complete